MKKRKRKILPCNLNDQSSIEKNDMQSPIHLIAKVSHSTRYKLTLLNGFLSTTVICGFVEAKSAHGLKILIKEQQDLAT